MTCTHCCGAEDLFNKKSASRDLLRYRKRGPNKTTKILLDALLRNDLSGYSLLDIGGGIGVIQHELLKKGIGSTTDVDASSAYLSEATVLMKENKMEDRMHFLHGDFVDLADEIKTHDIVTLERVVCCYPDVNILLTKASGKAENYLGLVYPRDNWFSRFLLKLMNLFLWIKRNPFRSFVHSEMKILTLLKEQGLETVHQQNAGIWKVVLMKRNKIATR